MDFNTELLIAIGTIALAITTFALAMFNRKNIQLEYSPHIILRWHRLSGHYGITITNIGRDAAVKVYIEISFRNQTVFTHDMYAFLPHERVLALTDTPEGEYTLKYSYYDKSNHHHKNDITFHFPPKF